MAVEDDIHLMSPASPLGFHHYEFSAAYENNETDWLLEKLCLFTVIHEWFEELTLV